MRERTMAIGRIIALVVATIVATCLPLQRELRQELNAEPVGRGTSTVQTAKQQSVPTSDVPKAEPTKATVEPLQAAEQPKPVEPPKPQPWAIQASPNGGTEWVNKAIAHYQSMGMTKQGVAMLVGNFLQEKPGAFTAGEPCSGILGDGGLAHGLGQWHPGRRHDMPCGFYEQLTWAVNVEMKRDSGGQKLYPLLFDANATTYQLDRGLKQWERYGTKGQRYQYGVNILNQL